MTSGMLSATMLRRGYGGASQRTFLSGRDWHQRGRRSGAPRYSRRHLSEEV
jgi:hypothetical protein